MPVTSYFRRLAGSRPFAGASRYGVVRATVETGGVTVAALGMVVILAGEDAPIRSLVAVAAGAGLFLLRHRFPTAVLLALAALCGPVAAVGPFTAATAYTAARRTTRARRRAWVLAAASVLAVASATAGMPWSGAGPAPYGLLLGLLMAPLAVVLPGLVGTVRGQQERLLVASRERGDAAERARRLADSEARMHERSRIAAEMHDLVGHRLSLISLHVGGLEMALAATAPELSREVVLVRQTTRDAMRELRQSLGVLGPPGRDTGPDALTDATGTRADIEGLVAQSRAGGIAVRLEWTGPDLDSRPAPVRRAVHRVVREALTNVHRYAGAAHTTVTIVHDRDVVRVTVRNGAPPRTPPAESPGSGRGLPGLRERVELLGGTLEAGALPSGGFQVAAVVPADPGDLVNRTDAPDASGSAAPDAPPAVPAPADSGRRWVESLTLAFGLVALCALMALAATFVHAILPNPHPGPLPLPRLGMTYQQVAELSVLDNGAVRAAATGREPPRPATAAGCIYPFNGATERRPDRLIVARYCFDASQHLIAIDRFAVPSVRDGAPWETP
ncbi:sensor histidine kinase [Nonomuraea sp. NPDC051191]|uniref:sensor histidine kinase n=1 Tax=Nonomuraea sp. NPDC051191 TaxID=3364372 RepID=UPI003790655E